MSCHFSYHGITKSCCNFHSLPFTIASKHDWKVCTVFFLILLIFPLFQLIIKKIHFKIKNCFIFFENNIDAEKTFDQCFIESFQSNLFAESVTENLLVSNFLFTCQYIWYSKELYRKIECFKHYFNSMWLRPSIHKAKKKTQRTSRETEGIIILMKLERN